MTGRTTARLQASVMWVVVGYAFFGLGVYPALYTLFQDQLIFTGSSDSSSIKESSDCIYFSVVTISTLGYGDIRPEGFAKFLAASEVLLGVLMLSIWLGYLLSAPD